MSEDITSLSNDEIETIVFDLINNKSQEWLNEINNEILLLTADIEVMGTNLQIRKDLLRTIRNKLSKIAIMIKRDARYKFLRLQWPFFKRMRSTLHDGQLSYLSPTIQSKILQGWHPHVKFIDSRIYSSA